jgi:hypothetical protein
VKIKVRRWAYLKKPVFNWFFENEQGGGFSNSGNHTTFKKCLSHARKMNAQFTGIPVEVYDVDGDGNETLIKKETL